MRCGINIRRTVVNPQKIREVMKAIKHFTIARAEALALVGFLAIGMGFQSCSENIDDSAFAIKTEQTIADYLQANEEFSEICEIFAEMPLGTKAEASPILSALSARGNYTVFAPTNEAVETFAKNFGHSSYKELTADEKNLIAYSCIIDNGTNSAYESPEFPQDGSAFALPDLNDRLITCQLVDSLDMYVLNGTSLLTKTDIELSNGYMHVVGDSPIAPSNKSVADLIKASENMQGMGILLEATGWDLVMSTDSADLDTEYEQIEHDEQLNIKNLATFTVAQHRYMGYTAFVETDDVFEQELGVSVSDPEAFLQAVTARAEAVYGTTAKGDLKNPDNAVNRFVAYHIIPAKISFNNLVRHFNEYGYKYGNMKTPQTTNLSVDVWDYYGTAGQYPALLKVSQDGQTPERETSHNVYLNRVSKYETKAYNTIGVVYEGVQTVAYNESVDGQMFDNNAKNGFYYPIKGLLIDNEANQNALGSERIRFDITTILPELLSNNVRGGGYTHFPNGYFNCITNESADTKLLYLNSAAVGGTAWRDYQGDEFMACGVFDFILQLPPVPKTGTYEFRFGTSHNSLRGMAQLYVGDDPNNLQPAGLPYDMRQAVSGNDNIGFVDDGNDESVNEENDRNMRNHGFMKAPRYAMLPDGSGTSTTLRRVGGDTGCLRRIITQQTFEKGKTYYVRFKSALEKNDAQFFLDYFEFCPSVVYNGTTPEDQW